MFTRLQWHLTSRIKNFPCLNICVESLRTVSCRRSESSLPTKSNAQGSFLLGNTAASACRLWLSRQPDGEGVSIPFGTPPNITDIWTEVCIYRVLTDNAALWWLINPFHVVWLTYRVARGGQDEREMCYSVADMSSTHEQHSLQFIITSNYKLGSISSSVSERVAGAANRRSEG